MLIAIMLAVEDARHGAEAEDGVDELHANGNGGAHDDTASGDPTDDDTQQDLVGNVADTAAHSMPSSRNVIVTGISVVVVALVAVLDFAAAELFGRRSHATHRRYHHRTDGTQNPRDP